MDRKTLIAGAAATILALGAGGAALATTQSPDESPKDAAITAPADREENEARDSDESLTGPDARKAADAALRDTDGEVLEVERGDDAGAAYEVEVREPNGGVTEVLLDDGFEVIGRDSGE